LGNTFEQHLGGEKNPVSSLNALVGVPDEQKDCGFHKDTRAEAPEIGKLTKRHEAGAL